MAARLLLLPLVAPPLAGGVRADACCAPPPHAHPPPHFPPPRHERRLTLKPTRRARRRVCPALERGLPERRLLGREAWAAGVIQLHVIALFTPGTCGLLSCWLKHFTQMMSKDDSLAYHVHAHWHQGPRHQPPHQQSAYQQGAGQQAAGREGAGHDQAGAGGPRAFNKAGSSFKSSLWMDAARPGGMYPEILFMREPEGSCGMTNWVANTGFILLRNTMAVQRFWYWVHVSMRGKMIDQDLANFLLLKKLKQHELQWGLLPRSVVTAKVDRISNETVAFHAVGVTGEKKFDVLKAALVRFYKNYESNL
ncbi:MAG: hypothetical protein SGPRY_014163, partial [Prymnesium sp.]